MYILQVSKLEYRSSHPYHTSMHVHHLVVVVVDLRGIELWCRGILQRRNILARIR
jgi:hypothetical protein